MIIRPDKNYVEYFKERPLSASAIKSYFKCPEQFAYDRFDDSSTYVESDAAREGTDLHCALLEPSRYVSRYTWFDGDRRTKRGKETWARLQESGMEVRKKDEIKKTLMLRNRVLANPTCKALLDACQYRELRLEFNHVEEQQLTMVAIVDALGVIDGIEEKTFGIDVKSVRSADHSEIAKAAGFGRWDIQEAVYRQAAEACGYGRVGRFYFLVVEREAPFRVRLLELGREERIAGQRAVDYAATCIVNRYKAWDWDSIGEPDTISYPKWMRF